MLRVSPVGAQSGEGTERATARVLAVWLRCIQSGIGKDSTGETDSSDEEAMRMFIFIRVDKVTLFIEHLVASAKYLPIR